MHELEGMILINGEYFSQPENFGERDRLNNLIGEAQDAFSDDGEDVRDEEQASELINSIQDALCEFAPKGHIFGAHEGDGSDFGYWPYCDSDENEYES
jgi:hypothetical protein